MFNFRRDRASDSTVGSSRSMMYPGQRSSANHQQYASSNNNGNIYGQTQNVNYNTGNTGNSAPNNSNGPGAYRVDRSSGMEYRVIIPDGVVPGQMFQVVAGDRLVSVRCPQGAAAGGTLSLSIPSTNQQQVPDSSFVSHDSQQRPPPLFTNPNTNLNQQQQQQQNLRTSQIQNGNSQDRSHFVTVPRGIRAGDQFYAIVAGQRVQVRCPPNVSGGMQVRINLPEQRPQYNAPPPNLPLNQTQAPAPPPVPPQIEEGMQPFEVTLPPGVRPGQAFGLMAGGRRVVLTAPLNIQPGAKIRFQLPISETSLDNVKAIQLHYGDCSGWTRAIKPQSNGRVEFQWKKMDEGGESNNEAFVRQMHYYTPPGEQHRTAYMSLVSASEAVIPGNVYHETSGKVLVSYQNIVGIQSKKLDIKATWLQDVCKNKLAVDYAQGHMEIQVRRDFLVGDSVAAIMSLGRTDLRKTFRFSFWGEEGIDAGGLMREWFQLVTEEICNPDFGLFKYSSVNQMCLMMNPMSEVSHPGEHLTYFRFLGRVLGKALFERVLVRGHFVRHLYKHLLGFPVDVDDIEMVDSELFQSLQKLITYRENGSDVIDLCLDFSVAEEFMGVVTTTNLIENGSDIEVTNENLDVYIKAIVKYQLMERTRPQLAELLLGFYDVIDEGLLTILDYQELELLLCGLPEIDLEDWKRNTDYTGMFECGAHRQVVAWFWDVVEKDFDQEMKARLLQFVTGTAGVPAQGFAVLQGNDGNIRKFSVHGVSLKTCVFPRAHTCFNRIDLPVYKTRAQLLEKITLAVQMEATGFGME